MILFCFDVVGLTFDVHETADCEDHEHKPQLMREIDVIDLRGGVGVIELVVDMLVELLEGHDIVPVCRSC